MNYNICDEMDIILHDKIHNSFYVMLDDIMDINLGNFLQNESNEMRDGLLGNVLSLAMKREMELWK